MPADGPISYDGAHVFSATTFGRRDKLGEDVTAWLRAHPACVPVMTHVRQSSDREYHCLTIIVFWRVSDAGNPTPAGANSGPT